MIKNQVGEYLCKKFYKGQILKPQKYMGYNCVQLHKNGKYKWEKVHRLVAKAFIFNPQNKSQVNHKNGNKLDNRVENLEWNTASENTQHAYDNGMINHYKKKIIQYDLNMNLIKTWDSAKEIEKELNIYNSSVCECCKKRRKTAGGYIWKYEKEVV